MKTLALVSFVVATAFAKPSGYRYQTPQSSFTHGTTAGQVGSSVGQAIVFGGQAASIPSSAFRGTSNFGSSFSQGTSSFGSSFGHKISNTGSSFGQGTSNLGSSFNQDTSNFGSSFGQGTNNYGSSFGQGTDNFGSSFGQRPNNFGSSFSHGTSNFGSSFGQTSSFTGHGSSNFGSSFNRGPSSTSFVGNRGAATCRNGQVRHTNGQCVNPVVSRNYYTFRIPNQSQNSGLSKQAPPPRVENNILFVRLPEDDGSQGSIVIPPPKQNNIVYLLNKQSADDQKPIDIPEQEKSTPEVYYVNYQPGENPTLPGGIDLQTALSNSASATGEAIEGSEGSDFSSGNFGGSTAGFSAGQSSGDFVGSTSGFTAGHSTGDSLGQSTSGFASSSNAISAPTNLYTTP